MSGDWRKKSGQAFAKMSIQNQLTLVFAFTSIIMFAVNLFLFVNVNTMIRRIDQIYSSNVVVNDLSDVLGDVQEMLGEYLETRSSDTLEEYYRTAQRYSEMTERLNLASFDVDARILAENVMNLSDTYMACAEEAVNAQRGRMVGRYKAAFSEASGVYQYINTYLYSLNDRLFNKNTKNYQALIRSFGTLEIIFFVMLILTSVVNLAIISLLTRNILSPVQERELVMAAHLKDAELRYLRAQINPHFLFNTLNAGAQLAMMEDAPQTEVYIQNVASFFRYRIRKGSAETTLSDEIALVDNYIYILNVRFSGEIHYTKKVDASLLHIAMPGMMLQPIVENAVNHGIRGIERKACITLTASREGGRAVVSIKDNGIGMEQEQIDAIMEGKTIADRTETDSNGVGLHNVMTRLELFYGSDDLFSIRSEGKDKGTEVTITLLADELQRDSEANEAAGPQRQ